MRNLWDRLMAWPFGKDWVVANGIVVGLLLATAVVGTMAFLRHVHQI